MKGLWWVVERTVANAVFTGRHVFLSPFAFLLSLDPLPWATRGLTQPGHSSLLDSKPCLTTSTYNSRIACGCCETEILSSRVAELGGQEYGSYVVASSHSTWSSCLQNRIFQQHAEVRVGGNRGDPGSSYIVLLLVFFYLTLELS